MRNEWTGRSEVQEVRELQSYLYISGGCNFEERSVSNMHIEVNLSSKISCRKKNIPQPKFAHGACLVGNQVVIAGGISDMMLTMGLRMVPLGNKDCYSYDIFKSRWRNLPDLPIGKMHPTMIVVNSRFVFHIGGFDDFDFDIYRLDMNKPNDQWKTISLDLTKQVIEDSTYIGTRNYLETLAK